jgi:mono/diheme cytochrome c family protein
VEVNPGEMTDLTLVFTQPGKYTFYCTRWCSLNHWRMRGSIEVTDPQAKAQPARPPLYVTLGLDIDAAHTAAITPARTPAAWRGALLQRNIHEEYQNREYYLAHTPLDLWSTLRSDQTYTDLSDQQVWDLVALVWQTNTTPAQIQAGKELYIANCAACHGEQGGGNGVFAAQLAAGSNDPNTNQSAGEHTQQPANFTDAAKMLSASPAHLQGKIIRGGMGTGMPSWGPILTEDQTWQLIAYLWTFQFSSEVTP